MNERKKLLLRRVPSGSLPSPCLPRVWKTVVCRLELGEDVVMVQGKRTVKDTDESEEGSKASDPASLLKRSAKGEGQS